MSELQHERIVELEDAASARERHIYALDARIAELEAELAFLKPLTVKPDDTDGYLVEHKAYRELETERDKLREALKDIARQMTIAEHDERHPEGGGDVEYAYDAIIGAARAALSP